MVQDFLSPDQTPEEAMLQQAIEAIREGQLSNARDLLTRLLRTNQNNATYWVWMSAAMETQKERLYCLQTAYKLDPENETTKRGLILMGALVPDENVKPFPMNHPRAWEEKFKLEEEKPKKDNRQRNRRVVFQLAAILIFGLALIGGGFYGFNRYLASLPEPTFSGFSTPRPTVTQIPGFSNGVTMPPLERLLEATYTPTPIYFATPHSGITLDSYRGAVRAYANGQWDQVISFMQQVLTAEPNSVDAYFFIAEAKRLSGDNQGALQAYQQAININPNYAPIYLGRARANLALKRGNVVTDLNTAITLDPNFIEAYVQRAQYYYQIAEYKPALADLQEAENLNPDSPVTLMWLARTDLALGNVNDAVTAAEKANKADLTDLDTYLVLGMAYREAGEIDKAVTVLTTYTEYSPNNSDAFTILGAAYYNRGDYQKALDNLAQALRLQATNAQAYYWQGETYLAMTQYDDALNSFQKGYYYDPTSFDSGMGIGITYEDMGQYNNAYIAIIKVEKLADTDTKRATFLYYRAISLEKISEPDAAYNDWAEILGLPTDAVPSDILTAAQQHAATLRSPTPLPPTATGTRTPIPSATRIPTRTLTPSATLKATTTPAINATSTPTP